MTERLRHEAEGVAATNAEVDSGTVQHEHNVASLASKVMRELGASKEERALAVLSAMGHDAGKATTMTPEMRLKAKLTPADRDAIARHPAESVRLLSQHGVTSRVSGPAGAHHVDYDAKHGYGVPVKHGSFKAQVLHAADVFSSVAVSAGHSYRTGNLAEARQVLREGRGTRFHPDVVDAIERMASAGKLPRSFYAKGAAVGLLQKISGAARREWLRDGDTPAGRTI